MHNQDLMQFHNIMPHFLHVVNRVSSPTWKIGKGEYHAHNIILVYEGEAVFGCGQNEYRAEKGSIVYFKPGDVRSGYTIPQNLMKCYAVDFYYICPVYSKDQWSISCPPLPFDTIDVIDDVYLFSRLLSLFDEFTKKWLSGNSNKVVHCRSLFTEILCLLLEWKYGSINYDKTRKVEKVIHFMTENYAQKLTLQDLAQSVNLSPSYLGTIFKEVTGKSPVDYLLNIRINRSKELIKDGHSISETATRVGFSDIFYFSKYFKSIEGVSPSYWANQITKTY